MILVVKIRELRIAENLTQENLAAELNVSFQSVSRWENGISTPDISLLSVIARFFLCFCGLSVGNAG